MKIINLLNILILSVLWGISAHAEESIIYYTSFDGEKINPYKLSSIDGTLINHTYENGQGKITFSNSITTIGDSAFYYCETLNSITIPEGVTSLEKAAFSLCRTLYSINLPSTINKLGNNCFQGACLKSISLPEGIETLPFFSLGFTTLSHISIPNSVKVLDTSTFECCYYLESIDIPIGLTSIGSYTFANCPSLKTINYEGTMEQWEALTKKVDWKRGKSRSTPLEVIHCSDGDINIDPWIVEEPSTGSSSFSLQMSNAEWSTICAPFATNYIHPELTIYSIPSANSENQSVILKKEYTIQAGKPYIVQAKEGNYKIFGKLYSDSIFNDLTNGLLIGALQNITIEEENSYVLQKHGDKVGFYHINSNQSITIPEYKAYLKYSSINQAPALYLEEDYLDTDNISEFDQRIQDLGYDNNIRCDWSDSTEIDLPEPYCAYINITDDSGIMPTTKNDNHHAYIELFDGNGNYLKKRIITNAQGSTSIDFDKKNFTADFCNDEWIGEDTPNIKFGKWVGQNSFHFKAYWIDFFRGVGAVGYQIFDQMTESRGEKIWQRIGHDGEHNKARCYPDGFPCAVYLNGKFEGIFSWQLKKHRKNMNMHKDSVCQIHLDGLMDNTTLLMKTINWGSFSVRNPKNLYTMTGEKYDINNPKELIDETSEFYSLSTDSEKIKNQKQRTAQVKKSIIALSSYYSVIDKLKKDKASNETIKAKLREQIDVEGFIDYFLLSLITSNYDGFRKNWQWFTYDSEKWCIAPYDLDCTFGLLSKGTSILPADTTYFGYNHTFGGIAYRGNMSFVITYFFDEIKERYAQLRDEGIFTTSNIMSLLNNWRNRVSYINYQNEWKRWPLCNCINETICNENWEPYYDWSAYGSLPTWNETNVYEAGDMVTNSYRIWRATGTTVAGVNPYILAGYKDSLQRINDWLEERIALEDSYLNYNASNAPDSYSLYISSAKWSTLCLPFSYEIPEGLKVFSVNGINEDNQTVIIKEEQSTVAHKPYLIYGKSGYYSLFGHKQPYNEETLVNGMLVGTYDTIQVYSDAYILQNQNGRIGFYKVSELSAPTIFPHRAYLSYNSSQPKSISLFDIIEEEDISSIQTIVDTEQQFIYYNIDGTRMNSLHKGFNLIRTTNGKNQKIIVK